MNWTAFIIFLLLFLIVTGIGFWAARWRRADLNLLDEWGLAGRRFGTVITWFLLGGDLYTAYTFIAVPALVFGAGATGFYAMPYTIVAYPFVFLVMPRLWSVAKRRGYVTAADFVKGRYDSKTLALVIALTGILATMPYIALQLAGMQAVLGAMGFKGEWALVVAFIVLAVYTYTSGLRAPAAIAIVKDLLIYVTVIVAVIVIPARLGGWEHIFHAAAVALPTRKPTPGALILGPKAYTAFTTLALGSAFALFLYPHSVTGVLSSAGRNVIKRNAALLPAYSFVLGLIALLGYMAIAAGLHPKTPTLAVPLLFLKEFPSWFAGVAFAAIAIGALVPAAIMSIAASNLFTRNIYREFINPDCTHRQESRMAKFVSLVVKLGALVFIVFLPNTFIINFQLLGGVWILQTLPAVVIGLYTRWFHRAALFWGWLCGMGVGTYMAIAQSFKSSIFPVSLFGVTISAYAAVWAVIVNLVVVVVLTWILRAAHLSEGADQTSRADYEGGAAAV